MAVPFDRCIITLSKLFTHIYSSQLSLSSCHGQLFITSFGFLIVVIPQLQSAWMRRRTYATYRQIRLVSTRQRSLPVAAISPSSIPAYKRLFIYEVVALYKCLCYYYVYRCEACSSQNGVPVRVALERNGKF